MNKVIAVTANNDFSLNLEFNDGSVKRFDAKPYLDYEVFRELKAFDYFKQVRVAFGTSNGRMIKTSARKPCTWKALRCQYPR